MPSSLVALCSLNARALSCGVLLDVDGYSQIFSFVTGLVLMESYFVSISMYVLGNIYIATFQVAYLVYRDLL